MAARAVRWQVLGLARALTATVATHAKVCTICDEDTGTIELLLSTTVDMTLYYLQNAGIPGRHRRYNSKAVWAFFKFLRKKSTYSAVRKLLFSISFWF